MTARRAQGWASMAIAGLAAGLVIAGLALGGGPMQARKERRDQTRLDDLNRLAAHVTCLSRDGDGRVMPTDLDETKGCPGPVPLTDPYTGAAYRFEPVDADHFRLCAGFELPPVQRRGAWQERDGDCITRDLPRPDAPAAPAF